MDPSTSTTPSRNGAFFGQYTIFGLFFGPMNSLYFGKTAGQKSLFLLISSLIYYLAESREVVPEQLHPFIEVLESFKKVKKATFGKEFIKEFDDCWMEININF